MDRLPSLHFVLLDDSLYKPADPDLLKKGVGGEAWAVHGGGFYHSNKYMVAPPNLPDKLHWSYWESYSTWLSGFALLTVLYFFNASSFLVDKRVFDWSPGAAIAGALAYLVLGWIVYDAICRIFGREKDGSVARRPEGRHPGVPVHLCLRLHRLPVLRRPSGLPADRRDAGDGDERQCLHGDHPGPAQGWWRRCAPASRWTPNHGRRGKQRSVHNTYFTLPVIIAMLSNHYGMVYQHHLNWVVLILLMLARCGDPAVLRADAQGPAALGPGRFRGGAAGGHGGAGGTRPVVSGGGRRTGAEGQLRPGADHRRTTLRDVHTTRR